MPDVTLDEFVSVVQEELGAAADLVTVDDAGPSFTVKPRQFLGKGTWRDIHERLKTCFAATYQSNPPRWEIAKANVSAIKPLTDMPAETLIQTEHTDGQHTLEKTTERKPEMPAFAEGSMTLEELSVSEKQLGQILPVIKDQHDNILDGFHRKRVNPNWKETTVDVADPLHALRVRVHVNTLRRDVPWDEKHKWVMRARALLNPDNPMTVTQEEVAKVLSISREWVKKYDTRTNRHFPDEMVRRTNVEKPFYGYNVWGFKSDEWRNLVVSGDPDQPDKEFYHGSTPSFVIRQLLAMFQPKSVLDSMAGVGTTGYVCKQADIPCDQFDIYPYPKFNVQEGDAEFVQPGKTYDLIFNHIPYHQMVKYGDNPDDLSTLQEELFFQKLERIFKRNYELLNGNGIYAVLVGDWRHHNRIIPIMAKVTLIGLATGFVLIDEAVKLTAEQKGQQLQEYRATKFGYLAQTFDLVLIFRKLVP